MYFPLLSFNPLHELMFTQLYLYNLCSKCIVIAIAFAIVIVIFIVIVNDSGRGR